MNQKTLWANRACLLLASLALTGLINSCWAATTTSAQVNISGTLTRPTCKINNNQQLLEVKFDDVDVTKIASGAYQKNFDLKISCGSTAQSIALKLNATAGFDSTVINTDVQGLGIKLIHPGQTSGWKPGSSFSSSTASTISIQTILVMEAGASFKGGAFKADASISVNYN